MSCARAQQAVTWLGEGTQARGHPPDGTPVHSAAVQERSVHVHSLTESGNARQADGRVWRSSEGWAGEQREFEVQPDDRAVMLVICPAGRHDDKQEPPLYHVAVEAPAEPDWACLACTYKHEGRQNQFLACAVCATPRQGS